MNPISAKPMMRLGPVVICEYTGPYRRANESDVAQRATMPAAGGTRPMVRNVAAFATNLPTIVPVAHPGLPGPVRVMIPVVGLIETVTVTAAPVGLCTHAALSTNG